MNEDVTVSPDPRPPLPDVATLLRLTLKTIGIGGIFAAVGYIALIAHQEFLGIPLEVNSINQLSFAAATFWFDSILNPLDLHRSHIPSVCICLLGACYNIPC
jgi:hypothetical protein